MRVAALVVAGLVGCSQPHPKPTNGSGAPTGAPVTGTVGSGTASGTGTAYDPQCADAIVSTLPEDGAQNAYYRLRPSVILTDPPTGDEVLALRDAAGALPGATSIEGNRLVFTPDLPLEPLTDYTAGLADCPPSEFSFRTSATGAPIDPATAVGTTYAVDLASGTWLQPPGVGGLLAGYLAVDVLVGVLEADADTLTVIGGVSIEGGSAQDPCSETVTFPPSDFSENPYFALGPQDLSMQVMGARLDLIAVEISGAFHPEFVGIQGASLVGAMDTRGLAPLLAPTGTYGDVCALLVTFGVTCTACPDGLPYCVTAEVEDLQVPAVAGPLVPRTADDIANDPSCP